MVADRRGRIRVTGGRIDDGAARGVGLTLNASKLNILFLRLLLRC